MKRNILITGGAGFIMLQVTSIGRIPNARSIEVSIHR